MRRRPALVAAAVGAVLVAGCGVAYAQGQSSSGSYRTATAAVGNVDQTLSLSGTITASSRRDLSFGVSGTVSKVKVDVGDVVRSGATLATLDDTDLTTAVTKTRATLAKAKAQLESDQDSQAAAVTAASTPAASSGSPSSSSGSGATPAPKATDSITPDSSKDKESGASPALTKALAALKKQQDAVTAAQTAASQAITTAKTALEAQTAACEDATVLSGGADAAAPGEGDDSAEDDASESEATPTASLSAECTAALDAVQAAQDVVADKQDTLQVALESLAATLTEAVKGLSSSTGTGSGSTPSTGTETGSGSGSGSSSGGTPSDSTPTGSASGSGSSGSGSAGGAGGSGGGQTVTAATLAKDQAAIDTAKADLAEAKLSREAAELAAPFAGEVLSVSAAKGDEVASGDVVIVLVGNGGTTATTTVTLEQVAKVSKGQTAEVTPAGASEPVKGTVTAIGMLPDTSSDTSTYPVTIDLSGDVAAPEGATASISLVIGTAEDVVTVPSSAVTTGGRSLVSVLSGGKVTVTPVTVGVVGSKRTEISEGLKKGQVVVLSDLNASLPSGDGTTTSFPSGGRGGFGGGMPGGGRPSAGGRG